MSEIILIDINAHTGVVPVTLRYATQGYVTGPASAPPFGLPNPIDKSAFISVSGNTVSQVRGVSLWGSVRARNPLPTTVKKYWECKIENGGSYPNTIMVGVSSLASALGDFSDAGGMLYYCNAAVRYPGGIAYGSGATTGDVIGVAYDPMGGTITFYKNNVSQGIITGLAGVKCPTVFLYGDATDTAVTMRGSLAEFAYAPPAGYSALDPTYGDLYYEGRIKQPGNIQRTVFDKGSTFGASRVGYGEVQLVNNDGALDYALGYGFAGFGITIWRGVIAPNASVPTWTTVLQGTMDSVDFSWGDVSIKVRDRQQELTKPLQATRYGGTNVLPAGLDGVATDIKGNGRPVLLGRVYNITPPQVNTARRIFELSDAVIQSVDAVYDRGTALAAGAAYASQADMETNAPTAGQYRAWLSASGSYIRLGAEPAGSVTVDATQGAAVANRTAAQLMRQVLLKGGIVAGDITAADVTALDAAAGYECGYWVGYGTNETGANVLDALCNSVGAFWGVDRLGKFRMGQIAAPLVANSIGAITALDIIKIDRTRSADQGGGVPAWQVTLDYARMFTVQSDLAAAVPTALKSDRSEQWRTVVANDATVKTQWPKAQEITFATHLLSATDAATEAARRLGLYKVRRDTLQARVKLSDALAAAIDLGKTITVQVNRFGMSAGKAYLVTGIRTDLRYNTFDLTLWG